MIGQTILWNTLKTTISQNKFPRFSILVGQKGSGRKLIANKIANSLGKYTIPVEFKVDSIRDMIDKAYKLFEPTVYIIADADNMSENAKNAILKIIEEPPNNAYFIMTLLDENNTLETIRSRGTVYKLDNYSKQELFDYFWNKYPDGNPNHAEIIRNLCLTPGQVDTIVRLNPFSFDEYVDLVLDNINIVSGANAFKIGSKLALNGEEDKYPLDLFWQAFNNKCLERFKQNPIKYAYGIRTTSKYLQELRMTNLSKQGTFDMWLLSIREVWLDYADSDTQ